MSRSSGLRLVAKRGSFSEKNLAWDELELIPETSNFSQNVRKRGISLDLAGAIFTRSVMDNFIHTCGSAGKMI
jgi:hypothetical protein